MNTPENTGETTKKNLFARLLTADTYKAKMLGYAADTAADLENGETTMTKMEAEIMRAKTNVEYCKAQFDDAVRFADRMASELKRSAEAGWNMGCPANNLANAAVEVGRIGERLETLKETLKTLTSLAD